jgi:hypothetical protein
LPASAGACYTISMQKLLLISLLAFAANPAFATASGHCDSKPFTLKKPVAAPPTAPNPPKTVVAEAKSAPTPAPPPKPKPKITIGCKQPAAK